MMIHVFDWISAKGGVRRFCTAAGIVVMVLLAACQRADPATPYVSTGIAQITAGESFTEGRLAAVQRAEKSARDQILGYVSNMTFPNGITLEEAVVTDPFIQAKVYDTIRTAKITDQTVSPDGVVTVTVEMDLRPILAILGSPEYGGQGTASASGLSK